MDLNPLNQLDPLIIGATVLVFFATYLMMRRVFSDKVVRTMEQRRLRCEAADELCREAKAQINEAEEGAAELAERTAEEAEGIVQIAREEAQVNKGRPLRRPASAPRSSCARAARISSARRMPRSHACAPRRSSA